MSSASASETSFNSSVSGPPGIRSALTILVFPTRAHSARICLTVASFAMIETRPLRIDTRTSAMAAGARASHVQAASAIVRKTRMFKSIDSLPAEIVDHLDEDVFQSVPGCVADHRVRLGQ